MSSANRLTVFLLGALLAWTAQPAAAQNQQQKLNQKFETAVAAYNAEHYGQAASELERLLPDVPKSFEAHELLGMVYAAQSRDGEAIHQLEIAVRLKPNSAAARTNLAASLFHAKKIGPAGVQFRKALELEPNDYSANHNLAEFYIHSGKIAEARPLLAKAQLIKPGAYDNGYDLAMADYLLGHYGAARADVQSILRERNSGELHNLLGQIDEKDGKYVAAANEFESAAHIDPSEENIFAWGSELLLHRTYEPAVEVFGAGARRYPNSIRLQIGLGMAYYARGLYQDAMTALMRAIDLKPTAPLGYQFLSKAYESSPKQASEVIQRFQHYAELEPDNAKAQYYYAVSLWKGKQLENSSLDVPKVEGLLKKAIALDGSLADAHLQLGNLYADQHEYKRSIPEYRRALQLDPSLSDAHYRLGTDYVHVGQKSLARKEFGLYQTLRSRHMAETDKERAAIEQFVVSSRSGPPAKP
ncbi:MAG TPA: tetratricopeptide repeat protein [Acidobacteriaceae bacterium]|nr:tetratricopeptide repeat protein [Acidobacteriaceae bacterium]